MNTIAVLVEDLKTDRTVWCSFYAVPRVGEHVEVYYDDGTRQGPGELLFTGNVQAVMWTNRDPRPTVRIK